MPSDEIEKRRKEQKNYYRSLTFEKKAVNLEDRTIEFSLSSEEPYERYYGIEILDHSPESINMDFIASGRAPILMDHDVKVQVGVLKVYLDKEARRLRAFGRFGKSELAQEILQDAADDIRTNISVGYLVHDMVLEKDDKETGKVYRVTNWTPLEASFVSIPADMTVGVGRSVESISVSDIVSEPETVPPQTKQEVKIMSNEIETVNVEAVMAARQKEIIEINALGARHNLRQVTDEAIANGKSLAEVRGLLLDKVGNKPLESTEIGMTEKEVKQFSFLRALNALANPNDKKAWAAASFEREVSESASQKSGKSPSGILVPYEVLATRDLNIGTSTAGGNLVATNLLGGSFIELLRKRMVTQRLGARILNGLVGNIAIPRHTGAATAYWVAESGSPTESQQTFDQVTMSPKTCGAFTDISRKMLIQSSVDAEMLVRDDLAMVIALELDRAALYGSGSSNQPTGLKNTSGINTKDFAAVAPTYAEIVSLETEVAADNADIGTLAYLVNARGRGTLKTTEKASSTGQFLWEPSNTINGYRAEVSMQVEGTSGSTEDYWFGNWNDLLIGFWSGLDLMVDPYTGSTSGTVRIVGLQDVDIAVRHPESFCRGANTL